MNRNRQLLILCSAMLAFSLLHTSIAAETGSKAPNCELASFTDDQRHELQHYSGKVLYVDFWSSWCPPCAKSFPFMNELDHNLKDKGLQIIGINLDLQAADAKAFLAKYPADFSVLADVNENCAKAFDVKAMPSSYLVDRKGVIRHVHLGFRPGEAKQLGELVEQLLAEP